MGGTHSEIKGAWLVTAKRYVIERHGKSALERIAAEVDPELQTAVTDPLPSEWYPEAALQQALAAMRRTIAQSDEEFLRVMRECTKLGVKSFFRALLRVSSAEFVLRQVPAMWRQIRRGAGRVGVETTSRRIVLHYSEFPYFADPNYRLLTQGSLTGMLALCTRRPLDVRLGAHGDDWLDVEITTQSSH